MVYNQVTTLAICVRGTIGSVGPTSNFGRLFIILIENTSLLTEFEYRPIKMPSTPYFMLVTTRGQRFILCLTINPTRGQYHSNGTTLTKSVQIRVHGNRPIITYNFWSSADDIQYLQEVGSKFGDFTVFYSDINWNFTII